MWFPPEGLSREEAVRAVDHAIRERRTRKVLDGPGADPQAFAQALREALAGAGLAPFHFARGEEVPEPWRFRAFIGAGLERVRRELTEADLLYGKLPAIFAGAGALVQASWLPEDRAEREEAVAQARDAEHLAAAAAAVQNLLLAMHARGYGSYWCSAPVLGEVSAGRILGSGPDEAYLGSLFFGVPLDPAAEVERGFRGKMHARRTAAFGNWAFWTED